MFAFGMKAQTQRYTEYDTLRKNEFTANVAPVIMLIGGGIGDEHLTNFSLGYRHYFKNKYVFRSSMLVFTNPYNNYPGFSMNYDRTVGDKVVFRTRYATGTMKYQLNIGGEKIFKVNRLIHGIGAEIFVNYRTEQAQDNYEWRPDSVKTMYTNLIPGSNQYQIDSLGYTMKGKEIGGGIHLFYTLRYQISKHWYVSSSIGPSINYAVYHGQMFQNSDKKTYNIRYSNMNFPNVPLISDISIAFRF